MPIADAVLYIDALAHVAIVFSKKTVATFNYSFGSKP